MNKEAVNYGIGLLIEEMGEVAQLLGKYMRFGDEPSPAGPPHYGLGARENLDKEIGDVLAALAYLSEAGFTNTSRIQSFSEMKFDKLINPNSKDCNGNRLAPPCGQ